MELSVSSMQRQKDMTPEDEPPKSEGMQHVTGEDQRADRMKTTIIEN